MRKGVIKIGVSFVLAGALAMSVPAGSEADALGEKNLGLGMKNSDVEELQQMLVDREYLNHDEVDGIFGPVTKEAVTDYQAANGLLVDGIAGTETIGALTVLRQGDRGRTVTDLQRKLHALKYYQADIDGVFGPLTDQAVKDFQQDQGIQVDGMAGPETFGTLNKVIHGDNNRLNSLSEADSAKDQDGSGRKEKRVRTQSVANEQTAKKADDENKHDVKELEMEATAYTAECEGCTGVTYTGIDLKADPDQKVVAVDPSVIPLGTTVEVEGYGKAVAADIGGTIKGNKIDVYMQEKEDALEWGRKKVKVRLLD